MTRKNSAYVLCPASPFTELLRRLSRAELRMGDTVTFLGEVDLTGVQALRASCLPGHRPSYTALVIQALAKTLREHPLANRRLTPHPWLPGGRWRVQTFKSCDIGVAVEKELGGGEAGVFADVIRGAEDLSALEITRRLKALSDSEVDNRQLETFQRLLDRLPARVSSYLIGLPARVPALWSRYRGGAAFVSAPCKYGVDAIVAAWPATLGVSFGLVKERAVVRNGRVVPAPTFLLTMNFDRRLMTGAVGARFFRRLVELLEHPGDRRTDPQPAGRAVEGGVPGSRHPSGKPGEVEVGPRPGVPQGVSVQGS